MISTTHREKITKMRKREKKSCIFIRASKGTFQGMRQKVKVEIN